MQIIFSTPDEREIIRRLCDDLATKCGPLYKQAHLLLKGAMEAGPGPSSKLTLSQAYRLASNRIRGIKNPNAGTK